MSTIYTTIREMTVVESLDGLKVGSNAEYVILLGLTYARFSLCLDFAIQIQCVFSSC